MASPSGADSPATCEMNHYSNIVNYKLIIKKTNQNHDTHSTYLEIAVDDVLRVEVGQGIDYLLEDLGRLLLAEEAAFDDLVVKLAALHARQ
jgi:hypothetical protein